MHKQRGSALISALFIMTLVAIAATAMSTRLQLDIDETHLTLLSDKLNLASQGVTFWAMDTLNSRQKPFKAQNNQGRVLIFPQALSSMVPNITLTGELYDLQARLNINNALNKQFYPLFYRLLKARLPKYTATKRQALLNNIAYWVSPYLPGRGQDKMLSYYLKQSPPYLPGYQPMQSISELRLVQGVTQPTYQKLLPYLSALPETLPININTAPDLLLKTLGKGLSATNVEELLHARGQTGITDLNDLTDLLQKFDIPQNQITLSSAYFLCIAKASSKDLSLTTYVVLKRQKDKEGLVSTQIVSQSFNTL